MKYVETKVVFEEIPDCVTLAVTISNCLFHCHGCHSDYLRKDIGNVLDENIIQTLITQNKGVNCILFLGDGNDITALCQLSNFIHSIAPKIKTAVYSGYDDIVPEYMETFDYIKTGKYIENMGPLNKETTNQRLYYIVNNKPIDITNKFWKER